MRAKYTYSFSQVSGKTRRKLAANLSATIVSQISVSSLEWSEGFMAVIEEIKSDDSQTAKTKPKKRRTNLSMSLPANCRRLSNANLLSGFWLYANQPREVLTPPVEDSIHRSIHLSGRPLYNFEHDLPPNRNAKGNYGIGPTKWFGQPKTTRPNHSHRPTSNPYPNTTP